MDPFALSDVVDQLLAQEGSCLHHQGTLILHQQSVEDTVRDGQTLLTVSMWLLLQIMMDVPQ